MADDQKLLPPSGIATTQQPQQPKRKGTGFTNLSRILQASQGSKLGQTIAGGISGQAQQVQSGIQSAQEKFRKEAEASRVGTAQDEINRGLIIQQAVSDPSRLSSDSRSTFGRYLSGEYKGPMELANQQQLANQAQQAESLGTLASGVGSRSKTGEGDRQELLRRFAGGADYTSGQRKLDESILARDPGANLAGVARQTKGVAEQAQRAGAVAQQEVQQYQNLAKIFAKQTSDKLTEAKKPISAELEKKLQNEVKFIDNRQKFIDSLKTEMKTNEFSQKSLDQQKQYVSEYLKKGQQYFSPEEYDQMLGEKGYLSSFDKAIKLSSDINKEFKKGTTRKDDPLFTYQQQQIRESELIPAYQRLQDYNPLDVFNALNFSIPNNLDIYGIADSGDKARMNALDLLSGKTAGDLPFSEYGKNYNRQGFSSDILNQQQEQLLKDLYDISSISKKLRTVPDIAWDNRYATEAEIASMLDLQSKGRSGRIKSSEEEINKLYDEFMAKQDAKLREKA